MMSVADLVDNGYRVIFGRGSAGIDTSHLVDEKSGEVLPMIRRKRVYDIDLNVEVPSETPTPFAGPALGL